MSAGSPSPCPPPEPSPWQAAALGVSPAEELKAAAATMRGRAQKADTGEPWEATRHYGVLWTVDLKPSAGAADLNAPDGPQERSLGIEDCDPYEDPRFLAAFRFHAEHIASWNPAVALAVADWLDCAAALIDASNFPHDDEAIVKYPLTVARAYDRFERDRTGPAQAGQGTR